MFEMRYCKRCLMRYLDEIDTSAPQKFLILRVPVEDDWGVVYHAALAIMVGDFLALLDSPQEFIDLADHATLLQMEDMRLPQAAVH